ncbi:hypothetical protein JXA84_04750 [candidate division WOR-3 bacterium]|nr:hypothetical protein [candidate division WOR-3 bacterium]
MEPLEILREATTASKVFCCDNSSCKESGELNLDLDKNAFLRACGSVKGAAASIEGEDIQKIIFHGVNITVAFMKQESDTIGVVWQEPISSLIQLGRLDGALKKMLETPPPQPEEQKQPEIQAPPTEEPEEKEPEKFEKEPMQREPEIEVKEKPSEPKIEQPPPPVVKFIYAAEVMDRIENLLEKYLEDFSTVIFENEISDLGLSLKGAQSFTKEQIVTLIDKLHDAASLMIGGSTANDMKEEILKNIKDTEREAQ